MQECACFRNKNRERIRVVSKQQKHLRGKFTSHHQQLHCCCCCCNPIFGFTAAHWRLMVRCTKRTCLNATRVSRVQWHVCVCSAKLAHHQAKPLACGVCTPLVADIYWLSRILCLRFNAYNGTSFTANPLSWLASPDMGQPFFQSRFIPSISVLIGKFSDRPCELCSYSG